MRGQSYQFPPTLARPSFVCQVKTNIKKKITIIAALAVTLLSCQKQESGLVIELGEPFTLSKAQPVGSTEQGDLSIRYDALIEDSRCPLTVSCLLPGAIIAQFELHLDGQPATVQLASSPFPPDTLHNLVLRLSGATPHPETFDEIIEEEEYEFELLIQPL